MAGAGSIIIEFGVQEIPGEQPLPLCFATANIKTGEVSSEWIEGNDTVSVLTDSLSDVLLVSDDVVQISSCFHQLGWSSPKHKLSLPTEFKNKLNGSGCEIDIPNLCKKMGIDFPHEDRCEYIHQLKNNAVGSWEDDERAEIIHFQKEKVRALLELYHELNVPLKNWHIRGEFLWSLGLGMNLGLPIDHIGLSSIEENSQEFRRHLVREVNKHYSAELLMGSRVSEKTFTRRFPHIVDGRFKPLHPDHFLSLDSLKGFSRIAPELNLLYQALKFLKSTGNGQLHVGADSRHRYHPRPFASSTGRSQPKTDCILSAPSALKGFLKAPADKVFLIVDYVSQEMGIAAALSKDPLMMKDYSSGDFYSAFARRVLERLSSPFCGTSDIRNLSKQICLAVLNGRSATALSDSIGVSEGITRQMIDLHHSTYSVYRDWRKRIAGYFHMDKTIHSSHGWQLHPPFLSKTSVEQGKDPFLGAVNFPIQATGSDILRTAVIMLHQEGYIVCATNHDSFFVEVDVSNWETDKASVERIITEASSITLGNLQLQVNTTVLMPGDRYLDDRDSQIFRIIQDFLQKL